MPKINLKRNLFWDVDIHSIDPDKHKRFIIARFLQRGSFEDFKNLLEYYGEETIRQEVIRIRYLDKKTLRFCSFFFKIPRDKFRCTKNAVGNFWDR